MSQTEALDVRMPVVQGETQATTQTSQNLLESIQSNPPQKGNDQANQIIDDAAPTVVAQNDAMSVTAKVEAPVNAEAAPVKSAEVPIKAEEAPIKAEEAPVDPATAASEKMSMESNLPWQSLVRAKDNFVNNPITSLLELAIGPEVNLLHATWDVWQETPSK